MRNDPLNIANQIIDGINQLNRGLFDAAKWVEVQAYEGLEDEYALAGDAHQQATKVIPPAEPQPAVEQGGEANKVSVSLVEVRTALSTLSQVEKTAQVRTGG